MANRYEIARAASLLQARTDLRVEASLDAFLGTEPSLAKLTEAALALGQPQVMLPLLDGFIHDATGTELERTPARMIVNSDEDGNRVESLHAVPLAQGGNHVTLTYSPPGFVPGLWLAGLGAGSLLLYLALGVLRRRKEKAEHRDPA